jgi:hypothetical protein
MNRETFDKLPYVSRKELIELRSYMKDAFEQNAHLIYEDNTDTTLYQFRDFTGQYAFNIKFHDFDRQKNINSYTVYFSPRSEARLEGSSHQFNFQQIKEFFNSWINLVIKMHEVTSEYYDPYKKFYDEQFAEYFTNDDADAAINPFEIEKQEVIYYFLTYAEKTVQKSEDISEESKKELLQDISQLKEDIPQLTKKRFVSSLSKFAQKAKKISNKVFHEIFDVLKKEVIKKLLYEAADQIPSLLRKVEGWINLLN